MDGKEVELKLALTPEGLERLKRQKRIRAMSSGRPSARRLSSTYYDTPDLDLARAGITVRLRQAGDRRLQTVKTAGTRTSGLFARREWEAPVQTNHPDTVLLRATGLEPLLDGRILERLRPVFSTEVRRTTYRLADEECEVELALDHGAVEAGEAREPICEAEFELVRGEAAHLFALARDISAEIPTRLLALSKSDRGYALASGRPALPVKARPVTVSPDQPLAKAFQAIASNCLEHLLANERALLSERDPEAVHQMRVALRRLRSAIKVFGPVVAGPQLEEAKADVRWLLAHLGPARDAHVFLDEVLAPVLALHPGHAGLEALCRHWETVRDRQFEAALAAVGERRFTLLLLDLGAWVEAGDWLGTGNALLTEPVGPYAASVLDKARRKMLKAGGKDLTRLAPEDLHQVRILGKRLRYAGEFFSGLAEKSRAKHFLGNLAELQDVLGELNDIAVALPRLAESGANGDHAWAAGLVAGWHESRRGELMERAAKAWRKFRREDPFWKR